MRANLTRKAGTDEDTRPNCSRAVGKNSLAEDPNGNTLVFLSGFSQECILVVVVFKTVSKHEEISREVRTNHEKFRGLPGVRGVRGVPLHRVPRKRRFLVFSLDRRSSSFSLGLPIIMPPRTIGTSSFFSPVVRLISRFFGIYPSTRDILEPR